MPMKEIEIAALDHVFAETEREVRDDSAPHFSAAFTRQFAQILKAKD